MKRQRGSSYLGLLALVCAVAVGSASNAALINASPLNTGAIALSETVVGGDSQVSTDFPGGEAPAFGLDGSLGTKFLMFQGEAQDGTAGDSGMIVFFPYPVTVQELRFGFGNDAPERDPTNFTLEGSNSVTKATYNFNPILGGAPAALIDDDAEWTPIVGTAAATGLVDVSDTFVDAFAARSTYTDEPPFSRSADTFTNTTAYTAYRILFPETRFVDGFIMQVAEVELLSVIPEPTTAVLLSLGMTFVAARRR